MTALSPIEIRDTELLPARADTDSWTEVVEEVALLAQRIAPTEFVPRALRGNVPATAAAILYGREVGLPPMTALSQIAVVEGRPGLSAESMRALVLAAGHEIVIDEATTVRCVMRGRRLRSSEWTPVAFTMDDARRANLAGKPNWRSYPADMLVARATTILCRRVFPDVIHGFRSVEELGDMDTIPPAEPERPRTRTVRRRTKPEPTPEPKPVDPDYPAAGTVPESPAAEPADASLSSGAGEAAGLTPPEEAESRRAGTPQPPPPERPQVDDGEDPLPIEIPTVKTPEPEPEPAERPINSVTRKIVFAQLRRLGLDDDTIGRPRRLDLLRQIAGRDRLDTSADLTQTEGSAIATVLSTARDSDALDELLAVATVSQIATPVDEEGEP